MINTYIVFFKNNKLFEKFINNIKNPLRLRSGIRGNCYSNNKREKKQTYRDANVSEQRMCENGFPIKLLPEVKESSDKGGHMCCYY